MAIFDFSEAAHIDTSAALSIESMLETAGSELEGIYVCGLSGAAADTLSRLHVLAHVPKSNVVATRMEAIAKAGALLDRPDGSKSTGAEFRPS